MKNIVHLFCQILTFWIISSASLYASETDAVVADALTIGEKVPDFVMPAIKGAPQRLSEYIGQPVMLIWLSDCNDCSEKLIDWQYFSESRASQGLKTIFIWQKQKGDKAPWSRLPILVYEKKNKEAWWFGSESAVMLINPDGILDSLYIENIDSRKNEILDELQLWLKKRQWLNLEGYK